MRRVGEGVGGVVVWKWKGQVEGKGVEGAPTQVMHVGRFKTACCCAVATYTVVHGAIRLKLVCPHDQHKASSPRL